MENDLIYVNTISEQILSTLKHAHPDLTVDQIGAAMIYGGCFLLSASVKELYPELKHSANIAFQCLAQSQNRKSD